MVAVARAPIAALPNVTMSQSGLMVAALIGGFIVFIAMQGKLGAYWTLMTGGGGSSTTAASPTTSASPTSASPTTTSTTSTTTNPFGLPSSAFPMLGGTANPTAAVSGGVGYNATNPGIFSGLVPSPFFSSGGS